MAECTRCKEEAEWVFGKDKAYCQLCWEVFCSETWWEVVGKIYGIAPPSKRRREEMATIDDDKVLSHWYDSREEFVVQFDPQLVGIKVEEDNVKFYLKDSRKEEP